MKTFDLHSIYAVTIDGIVRYIVDKEKQKAAVSAQLKSRWANPEYRIKQLAALDAARSKRNLQI